MDTQNENIQSTTEQDKLNDLDRFLEKQRSEWGDRIMEVIDMIRHMDKLSEAQVTMLSYRHMVIDQIARINITLRKRESAYNIQYKNKFIEYYNYDYKLNDKQKVNMVEADLSSLNKQIGFLTTQIDFFKECIKTLDNIGWAIKNKLNINELT
jgi:D-mannonate dehydratase